MTQQHEMITAYLCRFCTEYWPLVFLLSHCIWFMCYYC